MTRASDKLFCRLQDNDLITFGHYSLRDYETGCVLVDVPEAMQEYAHQAALREEKAGRASLDTRVIKYRLGPEFLRLKTVGLKLEFSVAGEQPIKDLTLVERHYFNDRLLRSFEFKFPFCMPESKNNCEFIYDMPQLTEEEREEMIAKPWETRSDSFFFVGDRLIIHNKAAYSYEPKD